MKSGKSAPSPRKPTEWPLIVNEGDTNVKIYRTPTKIRGKQYDGFTVTFFLSGKRQRRRFADFKEAKAEAKRIAEQKAQGELGAAALTGKDRSALAEALTKLAKTVGNTEATPARLAAVVDDWATATATLPDNATLSEAVNFYVLRHPSTLKRRTVTEIVDEFIADRKGAGCSKVHLRDLKVRLGKFAEAFQLDVHQVTPEMVREFIDGLKKRHDGEPVANRSKNNMLRMICSLFNYARREKYVPGELASEISDIPSKKSIADSIEIYSASEILKILKVADDDLKPALAIAAFAGLRLAEIARLDWRDIRWPERLIVVEAAKAKTRARRLVKITDNLASWLAPHVRPFGSINPAAEGEEVDVGRALGSRMQRAAAKAKVPWRRNALRHSFISYKVAVSNDAGATALEAGNSQQIIFSNYRALTTEREGNDWFGVMPDRKKENVVDMPASEVSA